METLQDLLQLSIEKQREWVIDNIAKQARLAIDLLFTMKNEDEFKIALMHNGQTPNYEFLKFMVSRTIEDAEKRKIFNNYCGNQTQKECFEAWKNPKLLFKKEAQKIENFEKREKYFARKTCFLSGCILPSC